MINNRTIAIAAVLALVVPALGAAAPVAQPVTEQLVEGHTVFAMIHVFDAEDSYRNQFAAAVAVLVRDKAEKMEHTRFPGVLWFNDQYLTNPTGSSSDAGSERYPCGGAVLAVNEFGPDPRTALINSELVNEHVAPTIEDILLEEDDPRGYFTGDDYSVGDYGTDSAWIGERGVEDSVSGGGNAELYTDAPRTGRGAGGFQYLESYLITDPNDHTWQIDVYNGYSRINLPSGGTTETTFKVWAVNILGSPVFTPDDGMSSCNPHRDDPRWREAGPVADAAISRAPEEVRDELQGGPQLGYAEPSANSYCYQGMAPDPVTACDESNRPKRLYNALLYFKLEHLTVTGSKDHSNHADTSHTNGCQVGSYYWECPAGDDNNEGFSHPFHPDPAGTTVLEEEPCPEPFYEVGGEMSNHGGSTTSGSNEWYDQTARDGGMGVCDDFHATANVDIYFSGWARPFPPVVPVFAVQDLEGSSAPYHCHTLGDPTNPDCDAAYL